MSPITTAAILVTLSSTVRAGPVLVVLDLDSSRPGIQSVLDVPAGTTLIPGVAVYLFDPQGSRSLISIGYLGALDRGIALGHIPRAANQGHVVGLIPHAGSPANPGNSGSAFPAMDRGFAGSEVQYIELGAAGPALLTAAPVSPLFTVDIQISGSSAGDVFEFAVMDFVSVWRGGTGGCLSTQPGAYSLDTGGDVTPDGTQGLFAVDPDVAIPVPPAAYTVDFIDGGSRPARVRIGTCYPNCDGSTLAPALNVGDFTCFINAFAAGDLYANCDGSALPPQLNVNDFVCFISAYGAGCP